VDILRDQVTRIEAFEQTGHPIRMQQHGLHVWPLIKYLLVKQTIFAMGTGFAATDTFDVYADTLRRQDIARKGWLKRCRLWRKARSFDPAKVLPDLKALPPDGQAGTVLLFGSASGFQDLGQGRVSVHHHALRLELAARGYRTLAFYADHPQAQDLADSSLYGGSIDLDPLIRHVIGVAPFTASAQGFLRPVFQDLEAVTRQTGHSVESLCAYADILTGYMATATAAMSALLRPLRPRAVFFSNYASFYGWAMAHVCRRLGIPCIDIQHGIEGRHNGAYHFAVTPPEDWNVLPTHHLTWTRADADLFTGQHADRRAAVMGTHTRQFARLSGKTHPEALQALRAKAPVLLFTAQFAPDILIARDLARAGLTVIFRSHPTRREETHALVDPADLEALHCQMGSETPLTQLIQACDGLITGYSATILEAAELGKPVFATGAFAEVLAQDYGDTLRDVLTVDPRHGSASLVERLRIWAGTLNSASDCALHPGAVPELGTALDALQAGI
jgi:hypothetical protein